MLVLLKRKPYTEDELKLGNSQEISPSPLSPLTWLLGGLFAQLKSWAPSIECQAEVISKEKPILENPPSLQHRKSLGCSSWLRTLQAPPFRWVIPQLRSTKMSSFKQSNKDLVALPFFCLSLRLLHMASYRRWMELMKHNIIFKNVYQSLKENTSPENILFLRDMDPEI